MPSAWRRTVWSRSSFVDGEPRPVRGTGCRPHRGHRRRSATSISATSVGVDPHGYSKSFCNFAEDINGDGRTDLIVVVFRASDHWFEQPEKEGDAWKPTYCPVTNNESPGWYEIEATGRASCSWARIRADTSALPADRPIPTAPWELKAVSEPNAPGHDRFSHGIGAGDINGDGRLDVLVTEGWWEQPVSGWTTPWKFHKAPFGPACAQMCVYDFDGDGDADVATSAAHEIGIWWYEQTKDGWQTHEIDNSLFAKPCALPGRYQWRQAARPRHRQTLLGPRARRRLEPGDPAVIIWFELGRKDGKADLRPTGSTTTRASAPSSPWPTSTATACWTLPRPTRRVPAWFIQQKP